jgi:hypothetical protein
VEFWWMANLARPVLKARGENAGIAEVYQSSSI